ncbi:response regulator [Prosthecomicrobium pneumaticum]|uniref:Two-component SAPR family response regulator n=1 Tax=Prosthecomicrobium pneumaticum TaxID=81895 RepID=A0A7W9FJR9_9HYPH|nr:response regulator [Prosthecomicrobium pneumaticum]MBB5751780.1 two-component SAPR family response regulator [Prosthecomicrobium pneumaticum]
MTNVRPIPAGLRVMVVEDEILVAMMLEDMLADLECRVVGPFHSIDKAREYLATAPDSVDLAILDVNVAGQRSFGFAATLSEVGVPLIFSTGYDAAGVDEPWRQSARLRKPFTPAELEAALSAAAARSS